jgi:hypothetical protein
LKLWLLDADIIIDFLSLDVFDKLVENHKVFVATTVINEVKSFKREDKKYTIDFRKQYVDSNLIREVSASSVEIKEILHKLPPITHDTIHPGELESLSILVREEEITFCSCDAAVIRALPFLDLSERGISAERLLKASGLLKSKLKERHTDQYFKNNLKIGRENKILYFESNS